MYDRQVTTEAKPSFDPLRYCIFTTIAVLAWLLSPAVAVALMSGLGLWAYGRAYRAGLRESRGGYVIFLDADDRLLPGAIATGIPATIRFPQGHEDPYEAMFKDPAIWI